ncbi:ALK and LTK ligand 2b-like [Brienomyrus brachyistius]|uniref:ALK and LTK ligand 2b-like n=1 Tax=Brienomyrus brachyistius TaxID=42636 RepID=UPI0020B30B69|nr:ALK and LTK ligand 2b-like [Brienomyrus brachyistius]XP_048831366.1 ALK and LTK ligand 2b-like [Brienomyrus brachyistius]
MSALRTPVFMGLVLLIFTAGYCKQSTGRIDAKDDVSLFHMIMDRVTQMKERQAEDSPKSQYSTKRPDHSIDARDIQDYKTNHNAQSVEVFPRDLRQKEKFLKHLTGPLYFSPRCSKHFYRLYHTTRDCTVPAYYKRCARLLTSLAGSQRCMDG